MQSKNDFRVAIVEDTVDTVHVEWKDVAILTEVAIQCMIDAHLTPAAETWVDLDPCVDPIPIRKNYDFLIVQLIS